MEYQAIKTVGSATGTELVLAVIGVMGLIRITYVAGRLVVRAANILESVEKGCK